MRAQNLIVLDGMMMEKAKHLAMLLGIGETNTTSVVQPLDAGIIHAFKAHYRTLLMRWLLTEAENSPPGSDLSKRAPDLQQVSYVCYLFITKPCVYYTCCIFSGNFVDRLSVA